jgi:DNA modification methylase
MIAAEQTARRGYGIEFDPLYCDVIIRRRLRTVCGLEANLERAGKSFQEIQAERSEPS